MKYKTLSDLKQAIDRGEVPKDWVLRIDSDEVFMNDGNDKEIFNTGPEDLLEQALDLLGISHEPV